MELPGPPRIHINFNAPNLPLQALIIHDIEQAYYHGRGGEARSRRTPRP